MPDVGGLVLLALPLLLLLLLLQRARRQQRHVASARAAIEPGRRVMMTSGVFGDIVSVNDDDTMVVEVAPGVSTTWVQQAVARVLPPEDPPETTALP